MKNRITLKAVTADLAKRDPFWRHDLGCRSLLDRERSGLPARRRGWLADQGPLETVSDTAGGSLRRRRPGQYVGPRSGRSAYPGGIAVQLEGVTIQVYRPSGRPPYGIGTFD